MVGDLNLRFSFMKRMLEIQILPENNHINGKLTDGKYENGKYKRESISLR